MIRVMETSCSCNADYEKIDEQGKFLPKAEKQYLCRNDKGDEKYLRSNDLKEDRNFEKYISVDIRMIIKS
ncbi:hypothetical protein [Clostridium neonatale]